MEIKVSIQQSWKSRRQYGSHGNQGDSHGNQGINTAVVEIKVSIRQSWKSRRQYGSYGNQGINTAVMEINASIRQSWKSRWQSWRSRRQYGSSIINIRWQPFPTSEILHRPFKRERHLHMVICSAIGWPWFEDAFKNAVCLHYGWGAIYPLLQSDYPSCATVKQGDPTANPFDILTLHSHATSEGGIPQDWHYFFQSSPTLLSLFACIYCRSKASIHANDYAFVQIKCLQVYVVCFDH